MPEPAPLVKVYSLVDDDKLYEFLYAKRDDGTILVSSALLEDGKATMGVISPRRTWSVILSEGYTIPIRAHYVGWFNDPLPE